MELLKKQWMNEWSAGLRPNLMTMIHSDTDILLLKSLNAVHTVHSICSEWTMQRGPSTPMLPCPQWAKSKNVYFLLLGSHQVWLLYIIGRVVRQTDLWSTGHGFQSRPPCCQEQPRVSCLHTCASVTRQYTLVPANGRWFSAAGR